MFRSAYEFNGDLSAWNTSKVTNMNDMFYVALKFNGDLSAWDTSKVTNMNKMFRSAYDSTATCPHGIPRKSLI